MPSIRENLDPEYGALVEVQVGANGIRTRYLARKQKQLLPQPITTLAQIDSGADLTCVESVLLGDLRLQAISTVKISGLPQEDVDHDSGLFHVSLTFTKMGKKFSPISVVGIAIRDPRVRVVLGRDFLKMCKFVYDGPGGTYSLEF